jgi:hypothetical protein
MATVEELEIMIAHLSWSDFEKTENGNMQVFYLPPLVPKKDMEYIQPSIIPGNTYEVLFCMRVGTMFDRPIQAIMAQGQFIRTRKAEWVGNRPLHKLDPKNPNGSLYTFKSNYGSVKTLWYPIRHRSNDLVTFNYIMPDGVLVPNGFFTTQTIT